MRIAHIVEDYTGYGGIEKVVSNLIEIWNEGNIDSHYLFFFTKKNKSSFYNFKKIKLFVELKDGSNSVSSVINETCKLHNIECIVFHGYHMLIYKKCFADLRMITPRMILITHFASYNLLKKGNDKKNKSVSARSNKILELLTFVDFVCVSKADKSVLLEDFSRKNKVQNKIHCIYNPVVFKNNYNPHSTKKNHIIYAGRLRERKKNSFLVVKIWHEIYKMYPNWKLIILGDGNLKASMIAYVNDFDLKNIEFLGVVDNVESYIQSSKIVILTSNSESMPQVLVEGIYFQNAIVTTNYHAGVKELVEEGFNGYIIPKGNHELFAKKLMHIMDDNNKAIIMGKNSKIISNRFSNDKILKSWKRLLNLY